jgi:hypothetical protein
MSKPFFHVLKVNVGLGIMLMLLIAATGISYVFYGPYYSPDTVNYFQFSENLFDQSPWSAIYSPFYPFLLHCLSLLPFQSLFRAAHYLILGQYALDLYFLYLLARITSQYYRFNLKSRFTFTLLILLVFHSWWSYRMVTWAHADALLYTLLIAWFYFMANYLLKASTINLLVSSILAAVMIWVKLNALVLVPFYVLWLFVDKNKLQWLIPLFFTLLSYAVYGLWFPKNVLDNAYPPSSSVNLFQMESFSVLWNNLATLFQTVLGFFASDAVTFYIPQPVAGAGGILLILSLIYIAYKEWKKGARLSLLFLLFALVFLLCQLAFQQTILFEEINYRTLFPFWLGCSWYLWIKLISLGEKSNLPIITLCLMITLHTLAGHFWLWKRPHVNSLFEVERILDSELMENVHTLRQGHYRKALLISDHPEKLGLLLNDPYIIPYDPDFYFINGKRRPVPVQERQLKQKELLQKLVKGKALLVLFGGDQSLPGLYEDQLLRLNYPEGTIFIQPKDVE